MDNDFSQNTIGKCKQMCPQSEIIMREREKLLHPLEMTNDSKHTTNPKADHNKIVKQYSRSAAGVNMTDLNLLRPYETLLETVQYLLNEGINEKEYSWRVRYDFICDRLRSVRQDMIIQDISRIQSVTLLQPIIRFHAIAAYKLCEENIGSFDPVLNNKQLQECLKRLLVIYDECDDFMERCAKNKLKCVNYESIYKEARGTIESIYLLHNMGDFDALQRAIQLPKKWHSAEVNDALRINFCYQQGNWIRVCRLIKQLPHLLAATASLKLPAIRKKCFQVMSVGFNSKNLAFPLETLKDALLYTEVEHLVADLKNSGINDIKNGNVRFSNTYCNYTIKPKQEIFVENKFLNRNIAHILVYDA